MSELTEYIGQSDRFIQLAIDAGITVDLNEWLTLKRYAERYGLASTNVVSNWIARGVIPSTDWIELVELNNMRLVKNKVYDPR